VRKQLALLTLLVVLHHAGSYSQQSPSHGSKEGSVPDAETAVKIAEAALIPVYGEKKIVSERPFKAALQGDVWIVDGTLHCGDHPHCVGGTAHVEIAKQSGQILRMTHFK
jgi:hypothetical protein